MVLQLNIKNHIFSLKHTVFTCAGTRVSENESLVRKENENSRRNMQDFW